MKQTINLQEFRRGFEKLRPENFTYGGLEILFDYFEELESDCTEEIEFDVIAICCEYSELTLDDINSEYDKRFEDLEDAEEWLDYESRVIGMTSDTIIFQQF